MGSPPDGASLSHQQSLHVGKDGRWRSRQLLNAEEHLIGVDRTDIDAEFFGVFKETRVVMDGKKRGLQSFGAFAGYTWRRGEWARHGEQRCLRKRNQCTGIVIERELARRRNVGQ